MKPNVLTAWLGFVLIGSLPAVAAPPDVTALYPAGAARGSEVVVRLQGKADPAKLELFTEHPGVEWVAAEGKDGVKLKIADDAPLGIAWLVFHNAEGASSPRPFAIGGMPELLESEPNNALPGDATPLSLPLTINGTLEKAGDVDAFPVSLRAGQTLAAALDARRTFGSPMDGLLQVTDARGFVLMQNDDGRGFDPRLAFRAERDGLYFVRVFAFPATPDSSIRFSGAANYIYRLALSTDAVVTRWQPPAVTAGTESVVRAGGWNVADERQPVSVSLPEPGFQRWPLADALSLPDLHISPFPVIAAEAENRRDVPQRVAIPACVTGVVSGPQSEQAWVVTATKGKKLRLEVATQAISSPLDAVLQVFDGNGKKLLEVDDAAKDDFEIVTEFAPPADGDYTITVGDRFWHGGPDYVYTLSISESAPDFALTLAASSYTVTQDKPVELPVTIDRRFGMASPMVVSVDGLPEGVTVEPVTSEPKGDTSKSVKLKITSTRGDGWIGSIRVVGRTSEAGELARFARVTPPEGQQVSPPLILKVIAKSE